jgi:hypothetical protein
MIKYRLTEETKLSHTGAVLHRIQAVRAFNWIKYGDLGGWVESERNLSHYGNCWIYDDAEVFEHAKVCGKARVKDNSKVYGSSFVSGSCTISDYAEVYGDARVRENAEVSGHSKIFECGKVYGYAKVCHYAEVFGKARVFGYSSKIHTNAKILGTYMAYDEKIGGNKVMGGCIDINTSKPCSDCDLIEEIRNLHREAARIQILIAEKTKQLNNSLLV